MMLTLDKARVADKQEIVPDVGFADAAKKLALVESDVFVVTPEEAALWLKGKRFERQRTISKANIRRLSREMEQGRFIPGMQIFICVLPDGAEFIINGNHTLGSVVASNRPQVLTVTRLQVADLDECGNHYAVFDIHKIRTWADSIRATGRDMQIPDASRVGSAVRIIREQFGFKSHVSQSSSRPEIINSIDEYAEAARLYAAAIAGSPPETRGFAKRANVMAVALETIRYQPSAGINFWHLVAHDNGLRAGNPAHSLLRWLRNIGKASADPRVRHESTLAAAQAWNANFRNVSLPIVRPKAMTNFVILGTPWDKGLEKAKA